MKRKGSAFDHSTTGSRITTGAFNFWNTRRWYTYTLRYAIFRTQVCTTWYISLTWDYYCLFGVGGKLPNSFKKTYFSNLWKYNILSFSPLFASDDIRFIPLFCPAPRWNHPVFVNFVFMLINKQLSISHDSQYCFCIFGFHRKEKVKLCDPQREIWILIY